MAALRGPSLRRLFPALPWPRSRRATIVGEKMVLMTMRPQERRLSASYLALEAEMSARNSCIFRGVFRLRPIRISYSPSALSHLDRLSSFFHLLADWKRQ
jgi:hypothetical protein